MLNPLKGGKRGNGSATSRGFASPMRLRLGAILIAFAVSASSCSTGEDSDFAGNIEPPDRLYNQALADIESGNSSRALERIEQIEKQHPYTEYFRRGLILRAYLQYRSGRYEEAIQAGRRYVSLYPGHDDADYAQYITGMSHFSQIAEISRDQSSASRAWASFNELISTHPESIYVEDAREKMRIAFDQLAGKEMLVGRYYLERREYLAAINRFRQVVDRYASTRHAEEALARLAEAYLAMGVTNEAREAAAVLGHNFPDGQWYRDTLILLRQQGGGSERDAIASEGNASASEG